jgi:hypothetical protein
MGFAQPRVSHAHDRPVVSLTTEMIGAEALLACEGPLVFGVEVEAPQFAVGIA